MQVECPSFAVTRESPERIYNDLRSGVQNAQVAQDHFGKRRPSFESWGAAATPCFEISQLLPRHQL
jgi:hypothetical protein